LIHRLGAFALAVVAVGLISCSRSPERLWRNASGKPVVLTTFTVLADMASQVAGDRLEVRSITRLGAEVHGYEPTPSDLEQAQGASLIVENGLGLLSDGPSGLWMLLGMCPR
jgi:manganese transport system substrate-binding protein